MHSELPTSGLPTSRQSWGRQYKGLPRKIPVYRDFAKIPYRTGMKFLIPLGPATGGLAWKPYQGGICIANINWLSDQRLNFCGWFSKFDVIHFLAHLQQDWSFSFLIFRNRWSTLMIWPTTKLPKSHKFSKSNGVDFMTYDKIGLCPS